MGGKKRVVVGVMVSNSRCGAVMSHVGTWWHG